MNESTGKMKYTKSNLKKGIKSLGKLMAVVMSLFIAALSLTGCAEEVTQQGQGDDGRIRFSATLVDGRGDVSITRAVAAQDTMSLLSCLPGRTPRRSICIGGSLHSLCIRQPVVP